MLRLTELRLTLDHAEHELRPEIRRRLGLGADDLLDVAVFRRGYDARKRSDIRLVYTLDLSVRDEAAVLARHRGDPRLRPAPDTQYRPVAIAPPDLPERPVVIGAGPCGLMAALVLAQTGFRPIVLERGRPVRQRTRDTWGLWRRGVLNPDSNVQFGEGGAGTFSDGKLWSQISDPQHYGRKVLAEFVRAGAPEEILWVSKPHIGTFRLVSMVEFLRAEIERLGGEYRFETKVTGFDVVETDGQRALRGLILADGTHLPARHAVLAIGHSARETFPALLSAGIDMQPKPFSIGVRIEHPQALIDARMFGAHAKHPRLGAADYRLAHHASHGRTAYSFCMCPGGAVVAATSEPGHVVTNGMSQYSRAERNANAGLVVDVTPADFPHAGVLAGIDLQRRHEQQAFLAGGGSYAAPAQRVADFLAGRASTALGEVVPSYRPGVTPTDLSACLPDFVTAALREALPAFARKIPGFAMDDAVMTGVETRTSAPVRLPRGPDQQSSNTRGLYPAGEGAGYAGGILSAGVDGVRVAESVARALVAAVQPGSSSSS
jgi:uncharacterized FAD-dependent dehydrogenase